MLYISFTAGLIAGSMVGTWKGVCQERKRVKGSSAVGIRQKALTGDVEKGSGSHRGEEEEKDRDTSATTFPRFSLFSRGRDDI